MIGGESSLRVWGHPAFRATLAVVMRLHLRGWMMVRTRLILGVLFYGVVELLLRQTRGIPGGGTALPEICVHVGMMFVVFPITVVMGVLVHEKANRQLGLLCMTALTVPDILLLRAAPWVIEAWLLLAFTLPAALLLMVLKGATAFQVVVIYLGLSAWIILGAGCGMMVGAFMLRSRSGSRWWMVIRLYGAILAASALPVMAHLRGWRTMDAIDRWLVGCSPFGGFASLIDPASPWAGVVVMPLTIGLGFLAFLVAVRCFPVDGLDDGMPNAGVNTVGAQAPTPGDGHWPKRSPRSRPGPGLAAITWREFHGPMAGGLSTWVTVAVAVALTCCARAWAVWMDPATTFFAWWNANLTAFACTIALVWILISHASLLGAELRMGTADLLFTLPLDLSGIVWAKRRALVLATAPLLVTIMITILTLPWRDLTMPGDQVLLIALLVIAAIAALAQVALLLSWWAPKSALANTMLAFYAFAIIAGGLFSGIPQLRTGPGLLAVLAGVLVVDFALHVAVRRAVRS